ncbi:MAG: hypothetical protein CBC24_03425 [Candidatus Pelagibacter sp. TMED64]|nr:lipid carrier--UDP-N-acetylgalactosaminyltransferase [Candidatus Pelagibacter sp.]OUU66393.1 MAG: hypothetical protein CBC24_03425 [Candidatus Pelagibacter sp. TMED64]|tara:strand:+ start:19650 stop:20207 length:558 start_codon:yes stop_codon:yes gene_type:complete
MKRIFDFFLAILIGIVFLLPLIVIAILIKISSKGGVIHWSRRIGKNNKEFLMPKFRTMKINTPHVATHLLTNPQSHLTLVGTFLRKTSLDELPQIYSIIKGDMSFVGPRPALFNQYDLIKLRNKNHIDKLIPGITGLAQINGRDSLTIPEKVEYEIEYIKKKSFFFDVYLIILTIIRVNKKNISH